MRSLTVGREIGPGRGSAGRGTHRRATVRSQSVYIAVLCAPLALVMGALSSLSTALPQIGAATQASQVDLNWIVDAYTVVFAGLLLACGALGDRYGRRRMLIGGLALFALGSAIAPIGAAADVITAGRAIAGIGAAFVMPATLSLLTTTLRGAAQERAVGLWAASATIGAALGIVLGGLALEFFDDWSAVFYASAAAAIALAAAALVVPESADPDRPPFDLPGAVTSAAAIGLVVFGILEAPARGWDSLFLWTCVSTGLLCGLAFRAIEIRRRHPLLDLRVFSSRAVLTSTLLLTAVFGVFLGYYFLAAQFLQLIEGLSPIAAGLTLVLGTITLVPGAVVAPTLVARFGLRPVLSLGLLPMIAAFLLLTRVEDGRSGLFVLSLLLLAATLGLCMTPATVAILHGVPPGKQGVASAINDAAREVGAALGIAVTGSVLATVYSRNLGPATKSLPPAARDAAESSLAGALQIGSQLGPTAGPAVQEAKTAFVSGLHGAFLASAVFTALVAIGVAAFGPRRTAPPTPALEQAAVAQRH